MQSLVFKNGIVYAHSTRTSNIFQAAYFKQVSADTQSQHVQAIATIRELTSSEMTLRMSNVDAVNDKQHITYINSGTATSGMLNQQIKTMVSPAGLELTNVSVFSSKDNTLALNVFSFNTNKTSVPKKATKADAQHITNYIADVKAGKFATDKTVPAYSELFNEKNMAEYLEKITPSYARQSNARRFLIQREMYEKVRGSEGALVHIEPFEASTWITIAAANVLPEVLLRLCSAIISARGLDVARAHLDSVADPTNNTPDTAGNVTMLRLLVSSKDVSVSYNSFW